MNTSSWLKGLTKQLGWTIVDSSRTVADAGLGVVTGDHRKIQVKARQEAVEVFEVTGLTA